jgi:PAS domain S-box-containing protein
MTRVLIVDDQEQNLYMLKVLLQGHGYEVRSARNGIEALDMARHEAPDLIITDILMPGMDGFSLCREWMADERLQHVPLVFYTATYTDPKDEALALSLGAARFIVKPAEPDAFVEILRQVLEDHATQRLTPPDVPSQATEVYYQQYSQALIRKLEDKMVQLEEANRALELDITKRKEAEAHIVHLNEVLGAVRKINQLIIREKDRGRLIQGACDILIGTRGFVSAWIGLVNQATGAITATAQAGLGEAFAPVAEALKRGELPPCGQEVLEQAGVLSLDVSPDTCPDCPLVASHGSRLALGTRLDHGGRVYGLLVVSFPEGFALDEEERGLLVEVAGDLAFGLYGIEQEEARQRAEEEIASLAKFPSENPNPVLRVERDGTLLYANEASYVLLRGWQLDIGQPAPAVLQEVAFAALMQQTGRIMDTEHDQRIISLFVSPVVEAGYANLYGRDVTDRRRAETALRESEERFKGLFENVLIGLYRTSPDGGVLMANQALVKLLGYASFEELAGRNLEQNGFEPGYPRSQFRELIERQGTVVGLESAWTRTDGSAIFVRESARAVRDEQGRVLYYEGTVEDITERKRAEEALRESEEKYRSVVERANDGITIIQDGIAQYANSRLAEMWGGSIEEIIGTPLINYVHPNELPRVVERYERRMAGEDISPIYETVLRHKDGSKVYAELNAGIITYQGKSADLVIVRDITERKRAEGEIRQLSQFLDSVIDNANVWLNVLDDKTGVVIWNKAAEEISGYSREEVVGHSEIWKWLYPDEEYRNEILAEATALIERGEEEQDVETIIRCKDGQTRTISWNSRGLVDEKGSPIGSIALGRDITERKRADEALRQRASQLALLNEIGSQVTALLDLDEVLRRAAQLIQERFGFHYVGLFTRIPGEDRLVMRAKAGPCAHLFPPDYPMSLGEGMVGWVGQHGETLLASDVAAEPRYVDPYPDDMPTRSELAVPIRIGGEVVGVLDLQSPQPDAFTPGDVTTKETLAGQIAVAINNARLYAQAERRNRELNLLNRVIAASAVAAEARIEPILDAVCRELALAFDLPHVSSAVYNAARTEATIVAEWLGPGRTSALGQVLPATGPASRHLIERKAPLVVEMDESGRSLPFVAHPAFQQSTSSLLLVPVVANGEVLGTLALDAGERRRFSPEEVSLAWRVAEQVSGVLARARLREQHQQLEEQFRQAQKLEAVGRLAGGIAHDFNNLLTVIHLSSRLLERKLHPQDPLRQHVDRIRDAGQRAASLTGQLLAFSRREIVEPRLLDLNQAIGNLDDMLRRIIGEDVELRTIPAQVLWPVKIDPSQVDQVIVNLAVNARDAMPAGGNLTIETANVVLDEAYTARHLDVEPGEYVLLAVSDTGAGMSKEVKAHLFEPFFTTKEKGKGTGLGLATVHGIVKQNGGHIWVYSEPGQGTAFKIYLPRVRVDGGVLVQSLATRAVPSARGTETLLLVEDEDQVRELIGDILTAQGYQVLAANDGVEALQVAGRHVGPIHLLLSDVVMPRMSGRALADELRASHPEMRVLYTSGYTDNSIVHHGVLDEGTHFLSKPFDTETLARKVRSVLDGTP